MATIGGRLPERRSQLDDLTYFSDDETVDEGTGQTVGQKSQRNTEGEEIDALKLGDDDDDKNNNGEEEEMLKLAKKKPRVARPFNEDVICSEDGLKRVYQEFPQAIRFRGRGFEAQDLKKLMALYTEWSFQLHPGLAFMDMTNRCEALGSKPKVRAQLSHLRERERQRYLVDVMHVPLADIVISTSPADMTSPEVTSSPDENRNMGEDDEDDYNIHDFSKMPSGKRDVNVSRRITVDNDDDEMLQSYLDDLENNATTGGGLFTVGGKHVDIFGGSNIQNHPTQPPLQQISSNVSGYGNNPPNSMLDLDMLCLQALEASERAMSQAQTTHVNGLLPELGSQALGDKRLNEGLAPAPCPNPETTSSSSSSSPTSSPLSSNDTRMNENERHARTSLSLSASPTSSFPQAHLTEDSKEGNRTFGDDEEEWNENENEIENKEGKSKVLLHQHNEEEWEG